MIPFLKQKQNSSSDGSHGISKDTTMLFTHAAASNLLFAASFASSEANRPSERLLEFDPLPCFTLETCDYVALVNILLPETNGEGTLLGVDSGSRDICFFLAQ